ncbi:prolipoprotein diacylglyceryl transferase [Corallococcus sp. M34]|uniref:prolipoprotein diacylglyceryl transferase n=1 Tax=Citreicoccus inhibens TaxID=2849499 RepID=UPI001C23D11D|nr:prolipoprotein diacylglyceryl transferase [Citreicoccus inhibens]MBU8895741.1 prolipoprotein diacylglyceryl transferase [Citreicoccus inhibens]
MLPVLLRLTFTTLWTQVLLYAVAVATLASIAYNGWRGAQGTPDGKKGVRPPTSMDRMLRAAAYAALGGMLAYFGLKYALPAEAFPDGRGEGIPIHTYGVLLATGFITAVTVASRLAQDEWRKVFFIEGKGWVDTEGPKKRELVLDMAFWVLVGGLVGSRALFVLVNWQDYARDWTQVFSLGGGLVFYGGLMGAGLAAFLFARKHQLDFLRLADVCIPTVSLGQCLGRLGCFSAGCCWGDVASSHAHWVVHFPGSGLAQDLFGRVAGITSLAYSSQAADTRYVVESTGEVLHHATPDAVRISDWVASHGTTLPVYPTQLFESVGQLVLFITLLYARRFRRFHGQVFAQWLMAYAVLRSTVELFRGDVERGTLHGLLASVGMGGLADAVPLEAWYNISTSQFISLCMFTFGAVLLSRRSPPSVVSSGAGPTPSAA